MKILLDHNVPKWLRRRLAEHKVFTTFQQGWSALSNGRLLSAAEASGFEAFVTLDRNLAYQQNLKDRKIAIAVLVPHDQSREAFGRTIDWMVLQLDRLQPGSALAIFDPETESPD